MHKPRLDHIGIAVRSIGETTLYRDLGLTVDHVETVETQKVRTAFISVGDSNIELLEPISEDSPIAKFMEKRGELMGKEILLEGNVRKNRLSDNLELFANNVSEVNIDSLIEELEKN